MCVYYIYIYVYYIYIYMYNIYIYRERERAVIRTTVCVFHSVAGYLLVYHNFYCYNHTISVVCTYC